MEPPNTKHPTTFLSLPAELRNKIYRLQLIRGTFCIYTCAGRSWSTVLNLYCASQLPLGLLRANRQIHSEAASILYGENSFTFPDPLRCAWNFQRWLEQIGPDSCRLLISVKISRPILKFHKSDYLEAVNAALKFLQHATELELTLKDLERVGDCKEIVLSQSVGDVGDYVWKPAVGTPSDWTDGLLVQ